MPSKSIKSIKSIKKSRKYKNLNSKCIKPHDIELLMNFKLSPQIEEFKNLRQYHINLWNKYGIEAYNKEEYLEAIKYLTYSSDYGDSDAQVMLCIVYSKINDINTSHKYFKLSLEQNNSTAQYLMSISIKDLVIKNDISLIEIVEKSYKIKVNIDMALYYLKLSAKQYNPHALFEFGRLYLYGCNYKNKTYIKKDSIMAMKFFQSSANRYHKNALMILGHMYKNGWGVDVNESEMNKYFELSNKQPKPCRTDFMNKYINK